MHMADALVSPVMGGGMLAVSAGVAIYSIKKIQDDMDDKKIPLMGVMGAFVFAAQMINFTIPGTGSSGHLGGGLLLAVLLGPYAGFLTMASVLLIQALFFGDGGLLAYGCNVFNLGFYTCFLAYPLIFKPLTQKGLTAKRILAGSLLAAVIGLQLGSISVVLETVASGKTEFPFAAFLLVMQPIHLAIGLIEGLVTAAVVTFVWKSRPEIITCTTAGKPLGGISIKRIMYGFVFAALIIGGTLSWFASANPDGLEWSMFQTAGVTELEETAGIHQSLAAIQGKTSILPDYSFKASADSSEGEEKWPAVNTGTSVSGLVGGSLTLFLAAFTGLLIHVIKRKKTAT